MRPLDRIAAAYAAAQDNRLTASETSVLVNLAWRAGNGSAWPSQTRIADDTRLTRRTVQRSLEMLVDTGLVVKQVHGAGRGNAYILGLDEPEQNCSPEPAQYCSPVQITRDTVAQGGVTVTQGGRHSDALTGIELEVNKDARVREDVSDEDRELARLERYHRARIPEWQLEVERAAAEKLMRAPVTAQEPSNGSGEYQGPTDVGRAALAMLRRMKQPGGRYVLQDEPETSSIEEPPSEEAAE